MNMGVMWNKVLYFSGSKSKIVSKWNNAQEPMRYVCISSN